MKVNINKIYIFTFYFSTTSVDKQKNRDKLINFTYITLGDIMIFCKITENNFIAKISNDVVENIDIFDMEEVEEFIKNLFTTILKRQKIKGEVELNIYIDNNYGMIVDIKNEEDFVFDDEVDIKIIFHLNNAFLYEIDYFDIVENTNIKNANIYFYNNNFYLELIDDIDKKDYIKLLEASNIIWDNEGFKIVNKGVKLTI